MRALILFIALSLFADAGQAEAIHKKVNVALGRKLVREALNHTDYKNSDFVDPVSDETFLIYPIMGATNGFLAHFAVNPWTGDVWNMDQCQLLINPQLMKIQAEIKKRFNKRELKAYKHLHDLKPYKMYDLEPCP